MQKFKTHILVEAGVMIALAQILSYIKVYQAPYGGSVTAGSMIPIIIFAIRWGWKKGIMVGAVYGVLQFILGTKWSFHPVSILFDYPLAFAPLGLAGLYAKELKGIFAGIAAGILLRFASHVISGVIVFAAYAPAGQSPWVYSILYNGTFLLPELVISLIITGILYRFLIRNRIAEMKNKL